MSTLQDFSTTGPTTDDEDDNTCEHGVRTLDEDPFACFKCWMTEQGSELFTEGAA